jgi:hypothetical protein
MSRTVTFTEPWGQKSWKVSYDGPYENTRDKHVEVGEENMKLHKKGDTYTLSNLHVHGDAVMWDVSGCKNGQFIAHFTVYYGKNAAVKVEQFK